MKTTCTYCGVGCQLYLWVQGGRILRVTGADGEPNQGRLCVKGRFGFEFVHSGERLTKPLVRKNGKLVETTLKEALDLVASKFTDIKERYGGRAFGGFCSAKCTNEDNYIFQKFMRAVLGTNSVEHCARLCHASTVTALQKAIGSGAMGNSIEEFESTDCILAIGSNPIETHPVTATYIKKGARSGAKIIVADPRKTPLVKFADVWLQQKGGTDVALVNGLVHVVIKENLTDEAFIAKRCEGGLEALENLKKEVSSYTPEKVEEITGVGAADLVKAARLYGGARRGSVITGMGMSQSTHGTDNVLALINLALITGNFGKPGTGINPLRGQNNVQGASDMGGICTVYPGYQLVTDEKAQRKFARAWKVPLEQLDKKPGLTTVEMIHAADRGDIKCIYVMGENPMLSDPNLNHTREALEKLEFLVVQDIFLTETAALADVVLPASCFAEKEGTVSNTDRRVLRVRKAVDLPGEEMLEDWRIIGEIADRMGYGMTYSGAAEIMEEIAGVTPSYRGIRYHRLEKGCLQWPCTSLQHKGTRIMHTRRFPSGLGKIIPVHHQSGQLELGEEYPFLLNTGRTLYHYHTGTMCRKSTPLNEYRPGPEMEIHPEDAVGLKLEDGERVRVISAKGEIEVAVKISDNVKAGSLFLTFHFSEAPPNRLTHDELDPYSRIPRFKQTPCRVEKIKSR